MRINGRDLREWDGGTKAVFVFYMDSYETVALCQIVFGQTWPENGWVNQPVHQRKDHLTRKKKTHFIKYKG